MKDRIIGVAALTLLLAGAFAPATAHADAKEAAKAHFENGVELFKNDDFEGALVEFKAAYEASPHYKVRYNIGMSLYKLKRYVEAQVQLKAFLDEGGDKIPEQEALEVKGALFEMQDLVGSVTVTCNVPGTVTLDGKPAGGCPFTEAKPVNVGEYDVVVSASGHHTFTQTVSVPGGKDVIVNAQLTAVDAPSDPGPVLPTPPPASPPMGTLETHAKSENIYIDGLQGSSLAHTEGESGGWPTLEFPLAPGEHEVMMAKTDPAQITAFETVSVHEGLTSKTSAYQKVNRGYVPLLIGCPLFIIGGIVTGVAIYAAANENTTITESAQMVLGIVSATTAGIGGILIIIGGTVYGLQKKKDKKRVDKYFQDHGKKVSLLPSPLVVHGGGGLSLSGTF